MLVGSGLLPPRSQLPLPLEQRFHIEEVLAVDQMIQ
jgi:hypothetical protein